MLCREGDSIKIGYDETLESNWKSEKIKISLEI